MEEKNKMPELFAHLPKKYWHKVKAFSVRNEPFCFVLSLNYPYLFRGSSIIEVKSITEAARFVRMVQKTEKQTKKKISSSGLVTGKGTMSKARKNQFYESIQCLNGHDLLALRKMIDERILAIWNEKESFFLHDRLDSYMYIVSYSDGSDYVDCYGASAYREYINNSDAVSIARYDKGKLSPTMELLMRKDHIEDRIEIPSISIDEIKKIEASFSDEILKLFIANNRIDEDQEVFANDNRITKQAAKSKVSGRSVSKA